MLLRGAIAATAATAALALGATLPAALADSAAGTYRVTLVNLTHSQPFSPPVAATHQKSIRMFRVGDFATDELTAIAQDGNEAPMGGGGNIAAPPSVAANVAPGEGRGRRTAPHRRD